MVAIKYSGAFVMIFFLFYAHAQLSENFSDGNFTSDPQWSGTEESFIINASSQLQSTAAAAGTAWLSTPCPLPSLQDVHWQTSVRQSFSPSASNHGKIYLVSNVADLTVPLQGYYLQFGEGGSDDAIELFRQDGATAISVCRGKTGAIASSFMARIDVSYHSGTWTIATDYNGGNSFLSDASGIDSTYTQCKFFGIRCAFTASNANKFFYDDINVGRATQNPETEAFNRKDIIITEIFPDPDPSVGMPEAEFIEIFNRTGTICHLKNWTITDGSTTGTLPDIALLPNGYVFVTSPSAAFLFSGYANIVAADRLPSLNNDSDNVVLKNSSGKTIDSVAYTSEWFHDPDKENGGWSLELIDHANVCGEEDNWSASDDAQGGTPGLKNSVFASKPDVMGPVLVRCSVISERTISLRFNEKLDVTSCSSGVFTIVPEIAIGEIHFEDESLRDILLEVEQPLQPGAQYTIEISRMMDCAGNPIQPNASRGTFALPEPADSLDILINEVLFNPRPLGVDFVEIYNASKKFISLRNAKLANVENGILTNSTTITADDFSFAPQSWLCLTSDTAILKTNFPRARNQQLFQCRLPGLSDDEGSVALISEEGITLDLFLYSDKFHSRLLQHSEGVSLERIAFAAATNDSQNWTSASAQSGYGTPGAANSCAVDQAWTGSEAVSVDPEIFAPLSGMGDFARIVYRFSEPGYVVNLTIVDQQARVVRTVANNESLSTEGFFRWDGDRDDGTFARRGFYVACFEVFNLSGVVKTFRRRVVIAGR